MKIDLIDKSLTISIRELAYAMDQNYHDNYISQRLRTKLGQKIHSEYQRSLPTDAIKEYYMRFTFDIDDWTVTVKGFADVVYLYNDSVKIEEIKSLTSSVDSYQINYSHELQLQLYAHYFREYMNINKIDAKLVIIDLPRNTRKIDIKTYKQDKFLIKHTKFLIKYFIEQENYKKSRFKRSNTLKFPYQSYRKYQEEIIDEIEQAIENGGRVILSAPPGLGKTLSSLYPALKYILKKSLRLFIVTSKTTQQKIYKKTLDEIANLGAEFNAIILTAKSKICHFEDNNCENNICVFLDNYFSMDTKNIISDILDLKVIDSNNIERFANIHEICPFELSLDVSLECDVIIGDYNYVFDPKVMLQRFFMRNYDDIVLIVDEAHNLPNRANDYYSMNLSISEIQSIINYLNHSDLSMRIKYTGRSILQSLYSQIQILREQVYNYEYIESCEVIFDIKKIVKLQDDFDHFTLEYIDELISIHTTDRYHEELTKDKLVFFSDKLKYFTNLVVDSVEEEFSQIFDVDKPTMRVLCKSSAKKIAKQIKGFHSVIMQSATIKPFDYFKNILGLPDDTKLLDYPSPYPPENSKYLIFPEVSTKYDNRDYYLSDISNLILKIISIKHGNYLVFFPSFSFMGKIIPLLKNSQTDLLIQETEMSDYKRNEFLNKLRSNHQNFVLLAVMGGIFSEGIDYPDDMAIGTVIIGPGLPSFSYDQELKKEYFDTKFGNGFDYAYRNPGITKVIQSSGRIFRKSTDKGIIVLVGRRFTTEYYKSIFPNFWNYQISRDVINEIIKFWNNN